MNEIKEYVVDGFKWEKKEGVIEEEKMSDVRLKIYDVKIKKDEIKRGGGKIIKKNRSCL